MNRTAAAIALLAACAAPALAQEPPPPTTTLELSLEDAVKRALDNNLDIKVEEYVPQASAFDVQGAKSVYDPTLTATLSESSSAQPS